MRVFLDTEHTGFEFDSQLISMALVCEDGREWYEVCPYPTKMHPWCAQHIIPLLGKEPLSSEVMFRFRFMEFMRSLGQVDVVADWYTDLVHFFQCFRGFDHGSSLALNCTAVLDLSIKYTSAIPHNALEDARAIRSAVLERGN